MREPYGQLDELLRDFLALNGENRFKLAQYFRHLVRSQQEEKNADIPPKEPQDTGPDAGFRCSFCGKTPGASVEMVQGPGVRICARCVRLCARMLQNDGEKPSGRGKKRN